MWFVLHANKCLLTEINESQETWRELSLCGVTTLLVIKALQILTSRNSLWWSCLTNSFRLIGKVRDHILRDFQCVHVLRTFGVRSCYSMTHGVNFLIIEWARCSGWQFGPLWIINWNCASFVISVLYSHTVILCMPGMCLCVLYFFLCLTFLLNFYGLSTASSLSLPSYFTPVLHRSLIFLQSCLDC